MEKEENKELNLKQCFYRVVRESNGGKNVSVLDKFLNDGGINYQLNPGGQTILFEIIKNQNIIFLERIIKEKPNFLIFDDYGNSVLSYAGLRFNKNIFDILKKEIKKDDWFKLMNTKNMFFKTPAEYIFDFVGNDSQKITIKEFVDHIDLKQGNKYILANMITDLFGIEADYDNLNKYDLLKKNINNRDIYKEIIKKGGELYFDLQVYKQVYKDDGKNKIFEINIPEFCISIGDFELFEEITKSKNFNLNKKDKNDNNLLEYSITMLVLTLKNLGLSEGIEYGNECLRFIEKITKKGLFDIKNKVLENIEKLSCDNNSKTLLIESFLTKAFAVIIKNQKNYLEKSIKQTKQANIKSKILKL